jgi:hypothetical protein
MRGGFFTPSTIPPLDWTKKFTAARVNEMGLTGYTMTFDPEQKTITVDFNGMGAGVKMVGSKLVFDKVRKLVLDKFYPGQATLPNTVAGDLNGLVITSVVVFSGDDAGDLTSCTINNKPLDMAGATTVGGFNNLKAEYNTLNNSNMLKKVTYY